MIYTWIYRIAVNTSLQTKRRLNKTNIDSLEETIDQFRNDIPEEVRQWESDPEKQYLYKELLEEMRKVCYHFITFRLTGEQRVVYILRVVLGFSLGDIGAILQIDKNTVKARLQRAKANLDSYFSGRCQWLGGEGGCNCESRIGFALSFTPDILHHLKNHPPEKAMKDTIRSSRGKVQDIDEIYRSLPVEQYQSEVLESYITRA